MRQGLRRSFVLGALCVGCLVGFSRSGRGQSAFDQLLELSGGQRVDVPEPTPVPVDDGSTDVGSAEDSWTSAPAEPEAPGLGARTRGEPTRSESSRASVPAVVADARARRDRARERLEAARSFAEWNRDAVAKQRKVNGESQAAVDDARLRAVRAGDRLGALQAAFAVALDPTAGRDPTPSRADPSAEDLYGPLCGRIVDAQTFRAAQKNVDRLERFASELDARIADLRRWRLEPEGSLRELERIHAEATRDSFSNLLSALPLVRILKRWRNLSGADLARAEAAVASLKSLASTAESSLVTDEEKRAVKLRDAAGNVAGALAELRKLPIPPSDAERIDTLLKAVITTQKCAEWLASDSERAAPRSSFGEVLAAAGSWVELAVGVAAVWCPPVEVGQGAYGLLEAGLKRRLTAPTIRDLQLTLSRSRDAERYLLAKKQDVELRIRELRLTAIGPYEAETRRGSRSRESEP